MMKKVLMIAATLMMAALVTGPVMAQGGMGGFQMPPELTKAMDKMRTARKNRMMIGRTVRAIAELNKDPKTALTKDQAKKVTSVLDKWASKPDMTEDQAKQVSKELTAPLATNISQIKKLAVEMQANNRMGGYMLPTRKNG
jgi:polyhydroxyalkanoate synthesis regulator phasin